MKKCFTEEKIVNDLFIVNITVNILIATAISKFTNPIIILDKYSFFIGQIYGIAIACLIPSYVFFRDIADKLTKIDLKRYKTLLSTNLLFISLLIIGSMVPSIFGGYAPIVISVIITANIIIVFWFLFLELFLNWLTRWLSKTHIQEIRIAVLAYFIVFLLQQI